MMTLDCKSGGTENITANIKVYILHSPVVSEEERIKIS